jgi:FkbM family methyltransferase
MKKFPKGDPIDVLQQLLPETASVCVDVGANAGTVSAAMLGMMPGRVVAFEPDARAWGAIEALGSRVTLHRQAVGAYPGAAQLRITGDSRHSSLYDVEPDSRGAETVPVVRLDDVVERADCVKIDAQGADVDVLKGAHRLLRQCPLWIIEVQPSALVKAGSSPEEVFALLREAGLTVCWADGTPVETDHLVAWREGRQRRHRLEQSLGTLVREAGFTLLCGTTDTGEPVYAAEWRAMGPVYCNWVAVRDMCLNIWSECYDGRTFDFVPNATVLEIGCAEADWQTPVLSLRPDLRITGIDWRKCKRPGATINGDVLVTEFEPESFDTVVGISSIEHIGLGHYESDPVTIGGDILTMQRVERWLKPGGWVYLDVPFSLKGYQVQGTKHRIYDWDAIQDRLIPNGLTLRQHWYANAQGHLVAKPDPHADLQIIALLLQKAPR